MEWVQYGIEIGKFTVAVAATYGLFASGKLLYRKMNEMGVNSALDAIRLSNKTIRDQALHLIDDLKSYDRYNLGNKEIIEIAEKVDKLYKMSYDSSKEVVTYLHFTSNVLKAFSKIIGDKTNAENNRVLTMVDTILQQILIFTTKLVSVPRSISTLNHDLVSKKVKPFLTDTYIQKYRFFDMGLVEDVRSSHFLLLFIETNKVNVSFSIAASKVFNMTFPILVYMYAHEIYAPVKLKYSGLHPAVENMAELRLIRIQMSTVYNKEIKDVVKLTYTDVGSARVNQGNKVLDNYYGVDFEERIDLFDFSDVKLELENSFTITVDRTTLEAMFGKYKSSLKRKLDKESILKRRINNLFNHKLL